jgi:hypothetical protein
MLEFLSITTSIICILIVWFNTDAFTQYLKLLGVKSLFEQYDQDLKYFNYAEYLKDNSQKIAQNNLQLFLLKLITCPICISFWLSLFCSICFLTVIYLPLIYLTVLIGYYYFIKILY